MNLTILKSVPARLALAGVLAVCSLAVEAAPAAEVSLLTGVATAASEGGDARALRRGSAVNAGELIETANNSYLSLAFADGGRVLLRPNSRFQVEAYEYAAPAAPASGPADAASTAPGPGSSKALFRLLRGGFRAVSGLIGKRDTQEYLVRTTVATIGIRGTDYIAELCSGEQCLVPGATLNADLSEALQVGVNEGAIEVTTPSGVYPVEQGQYGIAAKDGQFFLLPAAPMSFLLDPLPSPDACR